MSDVFIKKMRLKDTISYVLIIFPMKISHKIFIMILCVVVSSGTLYALNGTKSPKLPWQGIANASYDSVHNVGSSYLADARFTLMNSNTIVSDSITGLQWQSYKSTGSADYTANYAITSTWLNAKAYCAGLSLGGYNVGTWRLPTVKELGSIVDFSVTTSPSINTTYF